jgi:Na+/melibiose symporter-like transporter
VLSPNYDERSRIYGWWQAANVVGMLIVLTVPAILAARGYSHAQGVQAMGWFIIIFLPLTLLLALWKVPEPQVTTERDQAGLIEYLGLLKRPSVRRLLIADILIGTGPAITGALFFFYFLTIKEFESAQANLLLLGYFLGAFAGGPVWMRIAYRFGKHTTLAFAALAYAAIQIGVFIMPAGNFAVSAVLMFLAGLPFSAGPFLLRAMMADIGDEELLTSGKDRTGLLYAVLTGTVKIGSALAVFVTYQGLEMVGFDAKSGPNNPQTALTGLQVFFTIIPAALGVATAAMMYKYPLTAARQVEIRRELEARNLADAGPELASKPRLSEDLHAPIAKPIAAGE